MRRGLVVLVLVVGDWARDFHDNILDWRWEGGICA